MAQSTQVPITCRDCEQQVNIPVSVQHSDSADAAVGAVSIKIQAATEVFADHVIDDPEAHPSFVTRVEDEVD